MDEILFAHPEQEPTPNKSLPREVAFTAHTEQTTNPDSTLLEDGVFVSYAEPQDELQPLTLEGLSNGIDFVVQAQDKPEQLTLDVRSNGIDFAIQAIEAQPAIASKAMPVTIEAAGIPYAAEITDAVENMAEVPVSVPEMPTAPALIQEQNSSTKQEQASTETDKPTLAATVALTTDTPAHAAAIPPSTEQTTQAKPNPPPRQGMHPRLQAQLTKLGLNTKTPPENLEQWRKFLALTNHSYQSHTEAHQLLEHALAKSTQELHDLFDDIKQEENRRVTLIHRSEQKNRFMANMSHELRTPVHGILGSLEVLRDTTLNDRQRNFVDTAHSSCLLMQELVDNILDFSKIRSGHTALDIVEFSPRELVEKISQNLSKQAHSKDIQMHCFIPEDIPERVCGDTHRIRQALNSLVDNAVKFTEEGEVVVRVDVVDVQDENITLRFEVRDTGIGIPEDMHEHIFEPYVQVDSSSIRRFSGTGLGLAIAKELIELMGSKIQLESSPGKGSRFWFELSLPVMELHDPTTEDSVLNGRYILIVDHNETSQTILKSHLKAWKAKPISANSGMEALQMLLNSITLNEPFAAVLIDWAMPEMDGSTLARAIRSDRHYDNLPLIMLTHYGLDSANQLQSGVSASITKPLHSRELKELLTHHLRNPPVRKPEQQTFHDATQQTPAAPAILLAEDNPINALIATTMLEDLDFRVDHVENGQEAFRAVCNYPYQLVLMDVNMPEMDGHKATQAIREWEKGNDRPPVPVLAMTANALKDDRDKCLAAGMNDYIAKPIRKEDLLNLIRHWLEKTSQKEEESLPA